MGAITHKDIILLPSKAEDLKILSFNIFDFSPFSYFFKVGMIFACKNKDAIYCEYFLEK